MADVISCVFTVIGVAVTVSLYMLAKTATLRQEVRMSFVSLIRDLRYYQSTLASLMRAYEIRLPDPVANAQFNDELKAESQLERENIFQELLAAVRQARGAIEAHRLMLALLLACDAMPGSKSLVELSEKLRTVEDVEFKDTLSSDTIREFMESVECLVNETIARMQTHYTTFLRERCCVDGHT